MQGSQRNLSSKNTNKNTNILKSNGNKKNLEEKNCYL